MNILFVNLPYHGHVIPTVGLVQELRRSGHSVTYLLPYGWEDRIASGGARFLGCEASPKLDRQIRSAFFKAEEVIADFDLLIYEQFFFVGKHLAEKHGKPCVRIFTAPATNRELMQQFLSSGGPMGIFRFPFLDRLWTWDAVKGLGIHLQCKNWLEEITENPPGCNLVYTLRDFQPFSRQFPEDRFHFLGPSVYDRREAAFPPLPRPVICISLGTILKGADTFFRTCIDAFREEAVTVVLSVGREYDIRRLGTLPENFHVRDHIPQITVLKQSSLFITHGGMNSVSEAMAEGVPMIVLPFVSDQPVNARQVARLGLGKVLDPKTLTSAQLRSTALSILSDSNIQTRVQAMKAQVTQSPGNRGAVKIIEEYTAAYPR